MAMMMQRKAKRSPGYFIVISLWYAAVIFLAVLCLVPFLIMLVNSTRQGMDIMVSFTLVPGDALVENWRIVHANIDLLRGFGNSLLISVTSTLLTAYFSALTAYAFAMYRFKGRKFLFGVILAFMMVPAQLSMLGFYDLVNAMGLINTYVPLIVPGIAHASSVFFLRQYTTSVLPKPLLEAPRIDGAREGYIFHRIALPIIAPGIATVSIGNFIANWNNYLLPLILINSPDKQTLPLKIGALRSVKDVIINQGATYLAVAISVVPILIAFAFCSKYIIGSISAGSIKE